MRYSQILLKILNELSMNYKETCRMTINWLVKEGGWLEYCKQMQDNEAHLQREHSMKSRDRSLAIFILLMTFSITCNPLKTGNSLLCCNCVHRI